MIDIKRQHDNLLIKNMERFFAGIRISDVVKLRWSDFQDNRLYYVMNKNAEEVFRKTKNATKLFNKYLKRIASQCDIDKNLSNHIARHSFGNIAGDKIHPLMLQKLYRHSDLKTTLNYQANFIHKDADNALDSVINF